MAQFFMGYFILRLPLSRPFLPGLEKLLCAPTIASLHLPNFNTATGGEIMFSRMKTLREKFNLVRTLDL